MRFEIPATANITIIPGNVLARRRSIGSAFAFDWESVRKTNARRRRKIMFVHLSGRDNHKNRVVDCTIHQASSSEPVEISKFSNVWFLYS